MSPGMRAVDETRERIARLAGRIWAAPAGPPTVEVSRPPDELDGRPLLIGRSPRCDLVLNDPTVSRRHAELVQADDGWIVRDLSSTNGTRVNGWRIRRATVALDDELMLGAQKLRFGRR
jgi:pSer/pThr/pTyr-binding forkhead associated (FHA) protein